MYNSGPQTKDITPIKPEELFVEKEPETVEERDVFENHATVIHKAQFVMRYYE